MHDWAGAEWFSKASIGTFVPKIKPRAYEIFKFYRHAVILRQQRAYAPARAVSVFIGTFSF